MRRKIAKRKRREALRRGASIVYERFNQEPGWRRKDCGYAVEFLYNGYRCLSLDDDILSAYQGVLEAIDIFDEWDRGESRSG